MNLASQYAKRIVIEAKRRKLDPVAMVAIGEIESNFRPWAKLARDGSIGVFQSIPGDSPVVAARKSLRGCKTPKRLYPWKRRGWLLGMRGKVCEDQVVADQRRKYGRFTKKELQDPILATYVFAYELRAHLDAAKKRGKKGRLIQGCKTDKKTQRRLYLHGHYNTGPKKPRGYYVRKLCKRYVILRNEIRRIK
jgi:hypothetical protein